MRLNEAGLKNRAQWEEKGYALPQFDREKAAQATKAAPRWIHFGAGNIFRAFQANVVQNLLNAGVLDTGLIVAEGYDYPRDAQGRRFCGKDRCGQRAGVSGARLGERSRFWKAEGDFLR